MKSWPLSASGLQDISIRNKLLIAPAILILTLALITGLAMYGLNVQAEALNQVNEIALEQIKLIDQFSLLSEQVQSDVYQIAVLRFMEAPKAEIQPVQTRLEQGVNELKIFYGEIATRWPLDESEQAILERMKTHMGDFTLQAQQAAQSVTENPSFGVLMVRSSTLSYTQFSETLAELRDYKDSKILRAQMEMIQKTAALKTTIITLVLLMALAGIMMNLFISARLVVWPIQETTHLMSRLANNDLSIEVLGLERKDEIGDMMRAVEVFRNNAIEKARLDKELHESQQRFALAFHSSPYAVTITRAADGQMIEVNEGFVNITGYSTAESISKTTLDLNLWADEQDRAFIVSELAKGNSISGMEFRFRVKDGSIITGLFSASILTLDDQLCILSSINDITERKVMEEKLRVFSAELQRSNTELEQFAYVASHDLQEPLRTITSYLQLIEKRFKDKLDEEGLEFMRFAVDGAERMRKMIDDLLALSRVGTRGKKFVLTDCEAIFDHALTNLQATLEESNAKVTHDPLPEVMADAGQIEQLFQNLIGNAIKFRGKNPPRVHVSARKTSEVWEFSVRDNGIGIAPGQFERIFKIFQRLHTQSEYPGTGIGLAVCKRIVERHGGRMWIESQPEKGSTFFFTLPTIGESQ